MTEPSYAVDLAARLIRCKSVTPAEGGALRLLADELGDLGFECTWLPFGDGAARIQNLFARRGDAAPHFAFAGHTDVVPAGDADAWQHAPFSGTLADGKLFGRGAADMKSGLAAMAAAALKIKTSGQALAGDLVLAFSAGESSSCLGARRMIDRGVLEGAGALLVSEPSSLNLLIAETGAVWLDITATGTLGHASANDGKNAILKLMDFLNAVRDNPFPNYTHPLLGAASLAINTIGGGSAINLTPDTARATLDIRTVPGMTTDGVLAPSVRCPDPRSPSRSETTSHQW